MYTIHWVELLVFLILLTVLTKYVGSYLYKVLSSEMVPVMGRWIGPLEKFTYKMLKIDPHKEQNGKQYLYSLLLFSFISLLFTFLLLSFQDILPLNESKARLSLSQAFNIAASYLTNTNWQNFFPETELSLFSHMAILTVQNFISPTIGLCVAAALIRGLSRKETSSLGNFWSDLIRIIYYILLPLAIVFALFLLTQGVPQTYESIMHVQTLEEGSSQSILLGPIASQEAIKMLGTNGGGFTEVSSAHPFENPTPLSNFVQMLAMLLLPAAQTYYYGKSVRHQMHGWCIYIAMLILFVIGAILMAHIEHDLNPKISMLQIDSAQGNMIGKEMRFSIFDSTLFTAATTCSSCGATNAEINSFSPLSLLIALLNMQFSETIFGGVGSGLYSVVLLVIIAVFLAGLIIGRAPDYLGKKIETFEIQMTMFPLIGFFSMILFMSGWACISNWGKELMQDTGPHGFTDILYSMTSIVSNNGSSVLTTRIDTPVSNIILGAIMLIGRYMIIIPVIALAGSFAKKKVHPANPSSLPISGAPFTLLLISTLIIIGAMSFLPAVFMGPILEYFILYHSIFF